MIYLIKYVFQINKLIENIKKAYIMRCKCKKHDICEKEYVWNPSTCNCENGKYLSSIMDDLAIMCDEIIDAEAKSNNEETVPTNFNEKKATCKTQNFYILVAFLLITIAFLKAVSIYCYLINYQAKQKDLLPFHDTKLKQAYINNIN